MEITKCIILLLRSAWLLRGILKDTDKYLQMIKAAVSWKIANVVYEKSQITQIVLIYDVTCQINNNLKTQLW